MFGNMPDIFYHFCGLFKHVFINPLMRVPYLRSRLIPYRKICVVDMPFAESLKRLQIPVNVKLLKNFHPIFIVHVVPQPDYLILFSFCPYSRHPKTTENRSRYTLSESILSKL